MVYNFAYGSNLHPDRLRGRTNVEPRSCTPAVLRDWRLAFNLATGLSGIEPAMANIVPEAGATVHGLAIEMSEAELEVLVQSEGGARFYRAVTLEVQTYDGRAIEAQAFVAHESMVRDEVAPSERYIGLLREGARHHGLDEAYCTFLEAHPAAPQTRRAQWLFAYFRIVETPRLRWLRDVSLGVIRRLAMLQARRTRK